MIEPRVYRAAFIPALLAVVLTMFSLEGRPRPLPQGLAADVLFDGRLAKQGAAQLASRHPDRRAGSLGDRATGAEVARVLAARGFRVERTRFTEGGKELVNVVGRRAGSERRQVVVVAARDAAGVPDAVGSGGDTAALLELARVFEGRPSHKTLVLASIDGSALGEVGTERFARTLGDPRLVDGVVVMSDLAAARARGPLLIGWSNDSRRAGIALQRTLAESVRQELAQPVGASGPAAQLARLAFPLGIGAQGPLLERGYDAVRISGSGELPSAASGRTGAIDQDRLGGLGRATLRTVTALDQGPPPKHGPPSYVIAVSQVMPGWALSVLAIGLLLPALVAAIDAFARARRRRVAVGPWLRWLGAWIVPFLVAFALVELLALVGATPDPPPAPVAPDRYPLDGAALVVLAVAVGAWALAFWVGRGLVGARRLLRDRSNPGAACSVVLAAALAALVLWFVNPYAALMLVPATHLWLLAMLVEPAPPRRARMIGVAAGALLPLLVAIHYLFAFSLNPISGAWYLLLLVTGHSVGLITTLIGCVLVGTFAAALEAAGARRAAPAAPAQPSQPVYGPGAHAGPGALGGTESALGR
ncbi:MAG: hypothetical protein ABR581_05990 [Thermoleophilaceae bacterium]